MIKIGTTFDMSGVDAVYDEIMKTVDADLNKIATNVYNKAKSSTAFKDVNKNLRPSIIKRKSKYENGGYIVRAGGSGKKRKGYHAANVEFGHVKIAWGKIMIGQRVPPHPFLRPALDEGIQEAVAVFRSY